MKGSSQKIKASKKPVRLNRSPLPTLAPAPIPEPVPDVGGRPAGSAGLRKSLLREYGGEQPSRSVLELVDFYCRCDQIKADKSDDMKPRDLLGVLSVQKSILRMLSDLSGKTPQAPNRFSGMSEEEIDEEKHEACHLVWQPHRHMKDGTTDYHDADAPIHVHKNDEGHTIDYHPRRFTTDASGQIVPYMEN